MGLAKFLRRPTRRQSLWHGHLGRDRPQSRAWGPHPVPRYQPPAARIRPPKEERARGPDFIGARRRLTVTKKRFAVCPSFCVRIVNENRGGIMELTAVFKKVPEGYIAWVEDLAGANT